MNARGAKERIEEGDDICTYMREDTWRKSTCVDHIDSSSQPGSQPVILHTTPHTGLDLEITIQTVANRHIPFGL